MKKLGKNEEEDLETVEAYGGHVVDCSDVEVCSCAKGDTTDKYENNDRTWRNVAY